MIRAGLLALMPALMLVSGSLPGLAEEPGSGAAAGQAVAESGSVRDTVVAAALAARLADGTPLPAPDREGRDHAALSAFYAGRQNRPLWIDDGGPIPAAHRLLAALDSAGADGLVPRDYGTLRIATLMERGDSPPALVELELLLTHGALNFARDLSIGRVEPRRVDPELFIDRAEPDADILLAELAAAGQDPGTFLAARIPVRPEYLRLRAALPAYRALAAAGGWPLVPSGETLRPGERQPRVPDLRRRLTVTGEYTGPAVPEDPELYDPALAAAVAAFQSRHGLDPDGVIGARTLAELNRTAEERMSQIILNMERWRWTPADLGPDYLLVNLAGFTLDLYAGGQISHSARVVVGTPVQRTPVFSDRMTYLEVNPTWTVPPRIAKEEILPKLKKDATYLSRNNYTLFSTWTDGATVVDATTVDWSNVSARSFGYRVRQEPGDNNALGRIKFMFPNQFDVYLHDTPSKRLFDRANRTFSHGCIRVEDPFALAERVLALTGTTTWDRTKLDALKASGERRVITLKRPLPIHLTYITAFGDAAAAGAAGAAAGAETAAPGILAVQFRPDVYGRDTRLARALDRSRTPWPDPAEGPAERAAVGASGG
ncbi:MAG: hypothetical protein RLY86_1953 [Pseudomonadota bacterium]|jgi:murein L,D-transpeptidase YcbB/YkuD